MKIYLGIDMGGSSVKIAAAGEDMNIVSKTSYPSDGERDTLEKNVRALTDGIHGAEIAQISAAGAGAAVIGGSLLGIPVRHFTEFEAFGRGGQLLSGKSKALIVSMGTGTAFVRADGGKYTHLGGSGVGGGTLSGLTALTAGNSDDETVNAMIAEGSAAAVDLTVGDICKGGCAGLSPNVTAANFGKKGLVRSAVTDCDIAAGIANMIFQTAGVMAALCCKGTDLDCAVFTGAMTGIPEGAEILRGVAELHGIEFIIPENGGFSGALGAVLLGREKGE
ncbi:MAG: hypothetical protein NC120_08245 [Ruminococcus sp.]|nr:hypothetical protein [Ruminococcus sp.]